MKESPLAKPSIWCFTTYFAEGLPFGIIRLMSSVFFTDIGMKERYIGYLNFLGIPWNVKFIWAPFIDILGTKRGWMIGVQALITLFTALIAFINFIIPAQGSPAGFIALIALLFVILAFLSATNDISIDGYYMEGLPDRSDQAAYTGYRVFAYRIAMILARSGLVGIAAAFAFSRLYPGNNYAPWGWAFGCAGLAMLGCTLFHLRHLPRVEHKRPDENISLVGILRKFYGAFVTYSKQDRFILILVFIVFYKVGDEILFSMGTPFLMRELGVTKGQLSWLSGLLGAFGAIAGTSIGGIWIKKTGLKKAIWPLTILMNLNIWAYIWLAYQKPLASTASGLATIAAVHCYEQLAAGLGNAVLIVFILRTCKPQFKAAHYAVGSAIMSLFSTFFGGFGGVIVERMGYLNMFIMAFCVSIPAMTLLFWVPIKEEEKAVS
ncbi:MAG TPA: MFS transporter [Chitinivibrionales bacterium]|nr:MFS transporter [Chitinivibrionales bacterium]